MSTDVAPLEATIVMCSRDRPRMLAETVDSVLAGERVPRDLLIVDQSAVAHAGLAARGVVRGCAVTYLHSDSTGLSRARNIGMRAAACDVVVLLDDDMYVEADCSSACSQAMRGPARAPSRPGACSPARRRARAAASRRPRS